MINTKFLKKWSLPLVVALYLLSMIFYSNKSINPGVAFQIDYIKHCGMKDTKAAKYSKKGTEECKKFILDSKEIKKYKFENKQI